MKNLNNIEIKLDTDHGQAVRTSFDFSDETPHFVLEINFESGNEVAYLTKSELEQHIETCQLFLSKMPN